jgi:hypothetical protein
VAKHRFVSSCFHICLLTFAFCHLTCSFEPTEQVKGQSAKGKWQNQKTRLDVCPLTFAFCHLTCSFEPTEQVKGQNAKAKWQN